MGYWLLDYLSTKLDGRDTFFNHLDKEKEWLRENKINYEKLIMELRESKEKNTIEKVFIEVFKAINEKNIIVDGRSWKNIIREEQTSLHYTDHRFKNSVYDNLMSINGYSYINPSELIEEYYSDIIQTYLHNSAFWKQELYFILNIMVGLLSQETTKINYMTQIQGYSSKNYVLRKKYMVNKKRGGVLSMNI